MNYRKYYEKCIGRDILPNHEIHHLDSDRSNNHISNLVEIPKDLHIMIHNAELKLSKIICDLNTLRYFSKYNKEMVSSIESDYMPVRNLVFRYEIKRDEILSLNGFNEDIYSKEQKGVVTKILEKQQNGR